jgi:hypothetical protein
VCLVSALLWASSVLAQTSAARARVRWQRAAPAGVLELARGWLGPIQVTGPRASSLRLAPVLTLDLLALHEHPGRLRSSASHSLWTGRYGPVRQHRWAELVWSSDSCERGAPYEADTRAIAAWPLAELGRPAAAGLPWSSPDVSPTWLLDAAGPPNTDPSIRILEPEDKPCPVWLEPRPVTITRLGREWDRFRLLDCRGRVTADALDRLSVMVRPPDAERPSLPLPLEPDEQAVHTGEWLPRVRMVHPRLVWLVQQIANAFPGRTLHIVSGYRPEARPSSLHHRGRALDLFVQGMANERLFGFCRRLSDVGCGYYPNSSFVHVDIRPPGTGHVLWVDTARPGERSRYVDGWPGVVGAAAVQGSGDE